MTQILSAMLFWLFAAGTLVCGWRLSEERERALVVAIALSIVATAALGLRLVAIDASRGILAIDALLALFAIWVATRSAVHWPMWFAAFAILGALTAAAGILIGSDYWLYRILSGFWAVPSLFALLVGTVQDWRTSGSRRTRLV